MKGKEKIAQRESILLKFKGMKQKKDRGKTLRQMQELKAKVRDGQHPAGLES